MKQIKKVASVLLTIGIVLSFAVMSQAADIDVASLSDEDLQALKASVDAEITNRGLGQSAILPEGVYEVGKDVKAGSYVFTGLVEGNFQESVDQKDRVYPTKIICFDSLDDHENWNYTESYYVNLGNPIRKTFEDGMVFEVSYQSVRATYEDALPFAP